MFQLLPILLLFYAGPSHFVQSLQDTSVFEVVDEVFHYDIFDPSQEIYYGTFKHLIIASDPTIFSGLIYHGLQDVHEHRYITVGPTDMYQAHVYTLQMTNGLEMPLTVDAFFSESRVYEFAHRYGRVIGQMPIQFIERLVSFSVITSQPGKVCHSSRTKQWCVERRDELFHGVVEELMLHTLSHNFLDWNDPNRAVHNIFDASIIHEHEGTLNRKEWEQAASQDNFYLTKYAETHQGVEDIAESIMGYLAVKWRPERFDPIFIEYLKQNMANRFTLLDPINLTLP